MAKTVTVYITRKTYTLTLKKTDITEQILTIYYTDPETKTVTAWDSSNNDQTFTVKHGGTWTASARTVEGWLDPGTISPGTSGTISGTVSISVSDATYNGLKY